MLISRGAARRNKYNLEEMGYVQHIEVTYVVVQLCCLAVLMVISQRIARSPDDGEKNYEEIASRLFQFILVQLIPPFGIILILIFLDPIC